MLDNIVACGFDGLQSLQPSAGMDIAAVKKQYGHQLCLMGNLDLNRLMPFGPGGVVEQVHWLCRTVGVDGGFILSTCNILIDAIPLENASRCIGRRTRPWSPRHDDRQATPGWPRSTGASPTGCRSRRIT